MVIFLSYLVTSILCLTQKSISEFNASVISPFNPKYKVTNLLDSSQNYLVANLTTTIFNNTSQDFSARLDFNATLSPTLKPVFNYLPSINKPIISKSALNSRISFKCNLNQSSCLSITGNLVIKVTGLTGIVIVNFIRMNVQRNDGQFSISPNGKYQYFFDSQFSDFWVEPISIEDKNEFNQTIDINEVLKMLCELNYLSLKCSQSIYEIYYDFKIYKHVVGLHCSQSMKQAGFVSFSNQIYCTTLLENITMDDFILSSFFIDPSDLNALKHYQIQKPCQVSQDITQFIFDYKLGTQNCDAIQVFTALAQGQDYSLSSQFPMNMTKTTISSNFEVSVVEANSIKAEIGFKIILRTNFSQDETVEVDICFWSNVTYSNISSHPEQITIEGKSYLLYASQKQYYFILNQPIPTYSLNILNITTFIRQLPKLQNYLISQFMRGFKVYCGDIKLQIVSQKTQITNSIQKSQVQRSYTVSQAMNTVVSNAASVPNVGMLLRLAQFLNTLDDLSYFIYHNTTYDTAFMHISDMSWGWVNSKWLPPSAINTYSGVNLSSGTQPGWVQYREPLIRFKVKGQRMAFLDNCKGYLLYTVPSSTLLFLLLWKLFWKISPNKIASALTLFSSWAYLAVSLICDNGQYLSFHGFQQLRTQPINFSAIFSYILAVIGLFIATIFSFSLFLVAHKFACNLFKPPTLLRTLDSCLFLCLWTGLRFLSGFVHATIDNPLQRISYLFCLQFIMLISSFLSWPYTRFKSPHIAMILGHTARLILYFLIYLEVLFPEIVTQMDWDGSVSDVSCLIIQVVFVANSLQIILTVLVGLVVDPKDQDFGQKKESADQEIDKEKNHEKGKLKVVIQASVVRSTKRKLMVEAKTTDQIKRNEVTAQVSPISTVLIPDKALAPIAFSTLVSSRQRIQQARKIQPTSIPNNINIPISQTLNVEPTSPTTPDPIQGKQTMNFTEGNQNYLAKKYRQKMLIKQMKAKEKKNRGKSKAKVQIIQATQAKNLSVQ